ncbi:MAG TPA: hypothetical protein VM534_07905 [Thermoanaerobaculia bacterium]|nr:hypothetical protein [Thermoanaerobaculia bacterium]
MRLLLPAILMLLLPLAASPAAEPGALPTVGDPITLRFEIGSSEWLRIEESERFEVVSVDGPAAVIRSFEPGEFLVEATIHDVSGPVRVEERRVEIGSVLTENDSLEPAPLEPPHPLAPNVVARVALAASGGVALLFWASLLILAPRVPASERRKVARTLEQEFLDALAVLRRSPATEATLIDLAELTRRYLAGHDPELSRPLTSEELKARLERLQYSRSLLQLVREILDEADYAKFSGSPGRLSQVHALVHSAGSIAGAAPRKELA